MSADDTLIAVDGGARGGLALLPRLRSRIALHAFEPDEAACRALGVLDGYRAVHAAPRALAGRAGGHVLNLTRHRSLSSLLEPDLAAYERHFGRMAGYPAWVRAIEVVARVPIEATTLDAWAARAAIDRVDVLKLDTQGTELDILRGGARLLAEARVSVIVTEVAFLPVYRDQALFPALDRHLTAAGYAFVDCRFYPDRVPPGGWSAARYVEPPRWAAGGDAIYACRPERWPVEARARRAEDAALILAHLGYGRAAAAWLRAAGVSGAAIDERLTAWTTPSWRARWQARLRRWIPPAVSRP